MTEFLYLLLGLLLGGLAGVYWANTRARTTLTGRMAEIKNQVVRSSHQLRGEVEELRERLERKDRELEGLKASMEQERHGTTSSQARFQHLQDQKRAMGAALLGFARTSVADLAQFKELSTSLESFLETYRQTIEAIESRLRAVPQRLAELGVRPEDEAPRVDAAPRPAAAAPPASRVLSDRSGAKELKS